jgi:hypothetical protein
MLMIQEHKTIWRVAILVLLSVAMIGPWFFDLINVPAEYTCSAPNIRLYGDFCGLPLSGIFILFWMVGVPISNLVGLVTGAIILTDITEILRYLLMIVGVLLLVFPFFSTLLLIFRGDRPRLRLIHMVALGLAIGISLLFGLNNYPRLYWVLWGIWLFIGIAVIALILELLVRVARRRPTMV